MPLDGTPDERRTVATPQFPHTKYPSGTVRALLQTDLVTPATRHALLARLHGPTRTAPRFFTAEEFATLEAACACLIPQPDGQEKIDLAGDLDRQLASGEGDGWRYDDMPPDADAHRSGLHGLDQSAQLMFGNVFVALDALQQDAVFQAISHGAAPGAIWENLPAARYFEELLATITEAYYSHPLAQERIGYAGMADAHGWRAIGLNQVEPWEPRSLSETTQPANTEPLAFRPAVSRELDAERTTAQPRHLSTHRYALTDDVDAVVIGTGAGGAPLLARLARAGLRVVALEAGCLWRPEQDFATDERAQQYLFWNDERLSAGSDPLAFGRNNSGIGVGGTTLHYTAYTPRLQHDDLRLHSTYGVGVDWPLAYHDLEPYYEELEQFLGISGPSPYPWGPARRPYPLAPLPLNGPAQLMQAGCNALGIRTAPAANAALSAPYYQAGVGWRRACTNRGFCQAGCSTGAKASMDVTFIPVAIRDGAEVRTESFVDGLERDQRGRISGVLYSQHGQRRRQACRTVFVCAGAIETPRLLLHTGLANSSGEVGKNFMAHVGTQVWGTFDADVRPYKGIPGGLISEDMHRPHDADFAGGYLLQSIGIMPVTYASQVARGRQLWGPALHDHMSDYNHVAGIDILGECLPSKHNYMELSSECDERGLPKPRVHFTNGPNEQRISAHAERLMREIWRFAGARDVWAYRRGAHTLGTCRMGSDATQSVVDPEGRAHDVPNLYIADGSLFPSALSVNPALTIMALSLRIADYFLERVRRHEA